MGNYTELKEAIAQVIKTNGNNEITGLVMQSTLIQILNELSKGSMFVGVATPETIPGIYDLNVYYLAGKPGNYGGFDVVVPAGSISIIKNVGDIWEVEVVKINISNLYIPSKYAIYADENGWVYSYEDSESYRDAEFEIITNRIGYDEALRLDESGWVIEGWDWKRRNLALQMGAGVGDKIIDSFSKEVKIVEGNSHYGFPAICASKSGVMFSFYRKGLYHTGVDGSIYYKYSKDYGLTWSAEILFLEGGIPDDDGFYSDYRDSKAIRMSNGKILYSTFVGYAEETGNPYPNNVTYDKFKYKTLAISLDVLSDGTLDLANMNIAELPTPADADSIAAAGGLVERGGVIYYTAYSTNTQNDAYLFKSDDFAETWTELSKIDFAHNENSIAFIGDTLFCLLRAQSGNARLRKSEDFGDTWETIKQMDTYWHGMYLFGLGDTIMIAGRAYGGATNIVFINKFGELVLQPFTFGTALDSSYAQICSFENYIHLIYYYELSGGFGVYTRKIERNKVIGLSH